MAQLNLSDSGEDSGIENREHLPPAKPRKLPSLRSPVPSLVFYTKTPSGAPSETSKHVDSSLQVDNSVLDSAETTLQNVSANNADSEIKTTHSHSEHVLSQPTIERKRSDSTSDTLNNVVTGLSYSDLSRKRRESVCSVASTTSDISTDTYHTCYENVGAWSDSDDEDYMDTIQADEPCSIFING